MHLLDLVQLCIKLDLRAKLNIFVHNKLNFYTNMHVSFASNQMPFVGSGMAGLPNLKSLTALQNKTDQHRVKSEGFSVYLPNKLNLRADLDIFVFRISIPAEIYEVRCNMTICRMGPRVCRPNPIRCDEMGIGPQPNFKPSTNLGLFDRKSFFVNNNH